MFEGSFFMPKKQLRKGIDYMTDNELAIILRAMTPSLANLNAIIKETNAYLAGKITAQVVISSSPATIQNLTALQNQLTTLGRSATQTTATVNNAQQTMIRNEQRALQDREQMYRGHTNNVGSMFASHMKSMAMMAAVFGSLGLAKEGLVDFESGMAGVKQTLEETYKEMHKTLGPEEMARIGEGFSDIAERWGESSKEILEAGKSWSRQYKDVQTVQNLVNNSVLLSVVDSVPLEQSVRSLEAVLNQWGMVAKTAEEANRYSLMVVDSWSALAHKQMATATDLSAANAKMGAISAQMGLDFAHAQGLITSSLRATGFKGAEIGNMWKSVLSSIHSDKAIGELDKLGVAVKDLKGNFRPVQNVLLDLMVAMKGTEVNQEHLLLAVAGGKFQWAKLAASLGDVDTYLSATATSIASTGKAHEYMGAQMDTVSRKAGQLHQALIALVSAGGAGGLNTVLKSIVDNLRYFVDGLNNGGMKVVAFGSATYLAVRAIDNISLAIKTATAAGKAWNVTTAISEALMGNWAAIAGAAIVIGAVGLTVALGKQADAEKDLIEVNKNKIEQQKAMVTQYDNEIAYVSEIEQTRAKLVSSMEGMSDADERKIRLNDILSSSEEALGQVIGEEALGHLKAAGFSQKAFQLVVESLKVKQNAEQIAWQNTSKMVAEATNNLRRNILQQIEDVGKVTEAYGILGKLQENGLWVEKELTYARYELNPTPDNARLYDEMESRVSKFYEGQKNNRISELTAQLTALGGVVSDFEIPDIPTSDFKSVVSDDDENGKKNKSSKEQTQSMESLTQSTILQINQEHLLTKEKSDSISKELSQAQSQKDYAKTLELTNSLISNQAKELRQLNTARDNINSLKDTAQSSSEFGDISRWFTGQDNQESVAYVQEHNKASEEIRKIMEEQFTSLQKLRNAWVENNKSMSEINATMVSTVKTFEEIQDAIDQFNLDIVTEEYTKMTDSFETKFKHLDLLDLFVDENDLKTKADLLNDRLKITLSQIKNIEDKVKSINNMDLSKSQKEELFKQWSEDLSSAVSSYASLQNSLANSAQDKLDTIKDIEQTIIDMIKQSYEDEMDAEDDRHTQKIKNLNDEKEAYDKIIQAKIDSIDDEKDTDDYNSTLNDLQKERNDLQQQYDNTLMDTSGSADIQRSELQKSIEAKDKELQKAIYEHGVEYRKKSLTEQGEAFSDAKDDEIDDEEDAYDEYKKIMEKKMSDENLYYEAKKKLSNSTTKSLIADLTTYTNKFGDGMSLLGKSIKENLITNLKLAKDELANIPALLDQINASSSGAKGNSTTDSATDTATNPPTYTDSKRTVYGSGIDIASASQVLGTEKYKYITSTKPDISKVTSRDIVVGGSGIIQNFSELQSKGLTMLYGFDADATKARIQSFKVNGYDQGGVNTTTGLSMLHGTVSKPELILNDTSASKLFSFISNPPNNISSLLPKIDLPSITSFIPNLSANGIEINLNVAGNIDKTVLPDLKNALNSTAQNIRKELNKRGIYKGQ